MKKFELTENFRMCFGHKLFQIRALVTINGVVKSGETGGYIEKEDNLSQYGNSNVYGDAVLKGNSSVSGNSSVYGNAKLLDNAQVSGKVLLHGDVQLSGDAFVSGDVNLSGYSHLTGNACVLSNSDILQIKGLGTTNRTTTVYKTKDGIEIVCGCFRGGIEAFKERVLNTRSGKVCEEYLKFAELIDIYFGL